MIRLARMIVCITIIQLIHQSDRQSEIPKYPAATIILFRLLICTIDKLPTLIISLILSRQENVDTVYPYEKRHGLSFK